MKTTAIIAAILALPLAGLCAINAIGSMALIRVGDPSDTERLRIAAESTFWIITAATVTVTVLMLFVIARIKPMGD